MRRCWSAVLPLTLLVGVLLGTTTAWAPAPTTRIVSSRTHALPRIRPVAALHSRPLQQRHRHLTAMSGDQESSSPLPPLSAPCGAVARRQRRKRRLAVAGTAALLGVTVALLQPTGALAAAKKAAAVAAEEHLHLGQKIAVYCRNTGRLPDWLTIAVISAMPVVELRGGVPVGLWMGLPIARVFALCVAGNMVPIPLILLALRSNLVQKALKPFLDRARAKATEFGDADKQATALLFFVGIPLPGTGAWTGAMIASILGMPLKESLPAIFAGVVSAGAIMTALTLAGKVGALAATAVLAAFCISHILAGQKK